MKLIKNIREIFYINNNFCEKVIFSQTVVVK